MPREWTRAQVETEIVSEYLRYVITDVQFNVGLTDSDFARKSK